MPASVLHVAWETSFKRDSALTRFNFSSAFVEKPGMRRPSLVTVCFMLPSQESDLTSFYHFSQRNKSQEEEEANC